MNFNERLDRQIEDSKAELAALEQEAELDMHRHIAALTDVDRLNGIISIQKFAIQQGYSAGGRNERVIQTAQARIQELQ